MSMCDVYNYLKERPNDSFCNEDLATIFGINTTTMAQNTRKLRERGYINYDLYYSSTNWNRRKMFFYCNKERQPIVNIKGEISLRLVDVKQHSPHLIKKERLLSKHYKDTCDTKTHHQKIEGVESQVIRQLGQMSF